MLNLSEEWKKAYESFLEDERKAANEELDTIVEELMNAHNESIAILEAVEDYFKLYQLTEVTTGDARPGVYGDDNGNRENENKEDEKTKNSTQALLKQMFQLVADKGVFDTNNKKDSKELSYAPTATYTVQSITDMKFPQNLFFFIQQLIKWIGNVVLVFIEKIKNVLRVLFGNTKDVTEIDYNKLKLNLKKAERVETISTSLSAGNANDVIQARQMSADSFAKLLTEGLTDGIIKDNPPLKGGPNRIIVTLDFSRDIETLKILVDHFFDLFDNAYGTFNEKLFDASDLNLILKIFQGTLKRIEDGDPAREILVGGTATEVKEVSAAHVRQNLINTNTNIDALKKAYVQTNDKIKDIVKIISNKQLVAMTDLGVSASMLSSSTIKQLLPLVKMLPERLKEAKNVERDLNKVKSDYDAFTKKLQSLQKNVMSISNISYSTIHARRINELFLASRYMSDIVTLRLSGLTLYIKELKDLREILIQIAK